jgi:hypothetical protein
MRRYVRPSIRGGSSLDGRGAALASEDRRAAIWSPSAWPKRPRSTNSKQQARLLLESPCLQMGAGTGHPGTGRTPGPGDDAAVPAPQSGGARRRDPVARKREPINPVEMEWRRRELNPRPKVHPRGTLHACPLLGSRARREEAAKNRQAPDSVTSYDRAPSRRPIASLFDGVWPPTTRRGQGRRSQPN